MMLNEIPMNRLCVLVVGNLSEGHRFIGPFADFDAAAQFSEGVDADNWVATLEAADLPTAFVTAAAPELLAALKDLAYTTEAMSAYIPPQNAKIREEYVTRTHRAWQCIRKAEGRSE